MDKDKEGVSENNQDTDEKSDIYEDGTNSKSLNNDDVLKNNEVELEKSELDNEILDEVELEENQEKLNSEESKEDIDIENNSVEGKFTNKKKIILGVCLVSVIALGLIANGITSKYKNIVYPGTRLYESNLSKLNKNELESEMSEIKDSIEKNKIKIESKNNKYDVAFKDLIKTYGEDELSKEVMEYGKDGNVLQQFGIISIGVTRNYKLEIKSNEDAIDELVEKIYEENSVSSVEPQVSINGNDIEIKEGQNGSVVDKEQLSNDIKSIIENYDGNNEEKNLVVSFKEEQPKISVNDLKKVDTKISRYSTQYGTGGGRGKNIEVATGKVDNLLLMPGDEFSYENTVGPVTQSNGYYQAPVISNGELVQGIGGGICQVSTTIYNAQLKAGILPTERQNHSKAVSYVPRGLDATLASGSIDYKFKNTYDYPLVLNTYTSGGSIVIEFWSNKEATEGITYEAVSYASGKVANTYLYGYDSNKKRVYEKHIDTSVYR